MDSQFNINLQSTISKGSELLASEMDGEVVMMSIENGKYYGMNKLGSEIWKMIDAPVQVADICQTLGKTFSVEQSTCETEVLDFVNHLAKEKLIKTVA